MKNLYEIIQSHLDKFASSLYTLSPARILKVNTDGENILSVDVKPQVKQLYGDGVDLDRPTIYSVPLLLPSSSSGIISFPVKEGDPVLLGFCRENIEDWLDTGEYGTSPTFRRFSQTDAVAFPCLFPDGESPGAHKDNMVLKFSDNTFTITPDGDVLVDNSGDFKVSVGGGVSISNSSVELVQFIEDLCQELSQTKVIIPSGSSAGTYPIDNAASITALKDLISQLKA